MSDIGEILDFLDALPADADLDAARNEEEGDEFDFEGSVVYPVDWDGLLREPAPESQAEDFDLDLDISELPDGLRPGSRTANPTAPRALRGPWRRCAWYAPITFYRQGFGIFIRQDCILDLAHDMAPFVLGGGHTISRLDYLTLRRLAFYTYFLHEQFHHKTESFAIRLAVAENRPVYERYHYVAYRPAKRSSPGLLIEEALAGADAYRRITEDRYKRSVGHTFRGFRRYLDLALPTMPAGYNLAPAYLANTQWDDGEAHLQACVQQATYHPIAPQPWHIATHMTRALFPIESKIWVVVRAGSRPVVPTFAPAATESTRRIRALLKALGYTKSKRSGPHEIWEKPGAKQIQVPRHSTLTDGVLNSIASSLGIRGTTELVRQARLA
jgi:predicted RNA binding protein YcfA (HicA-like mRNA interferase family)